LNLSFHIARRYLVSKKSNNAINIISWISIVAIAITTAALIIILSAMNGLTGVIADLYNAIEPDIKILPSTGKFFVADDAFMAKIKAVKGVNEISSCVSDNALIKNGDKQSIITIKGVDDKFKVVTHFDSVIKEGSFHLKHGKDRFAVFGRGIADELGININNLIEQVAIYSPKRGLEESLNPDDNFNQKYVFPSGVFALNNELDFKYVLVDIDVARELLDCSNEVSTLEISLEPGANMKDVQKQLAGILGNKFTIKNRYQLNDVLFKTLESEKLWTFIILAFILIIATFNIIGALTMLIIEKKKDIRTLYCLGADNTLISRIFMGEGFLITAIGTGIGLSLGLIVCLLQMKYHFIESNDKYVIPYYPVVLEAKDFIWIISLIMLIGFFAALYPVRVFTRNDFVHESD
jgi:lipoprotein-releasing system permease protein